jgi:hypothetical protein
MATFLVGLQPTNQHGRINRTSGLTLFYFFFLIVLLLLLGGELIPADESDPIG